MTTCSPIIISASRRTDIPAFFAEWFVYRWRKNYCITMNPYNKSQQKILFDKTRLIVFWSKNPKPIIPYLKPIQKQNINFYFLYTINDYEKEGFEPFVPSLTTRIDTFKKLSDEFGPGKVAWRFDPLILSKEINLEILLSKMAKIGDQLKGFSKKLIFSFVEIENYHKVQRNLLGYNCREFSNPEKEEFVVALNQLNQNWKFDEISWCTCSSDFSQLGVSKGKCISDDTILKEYKQDEILQYFAKTYKKDKGQRLHCGCIESKDIGTYNTCQHGCRYCYGCNYTEKLKPIYQNFNTTSKLLSFNTKD